MGAAVGLVVLAGVLLGGRAVVNAVAFPPSAPVEQYIAALDEGRLEDAFAIADPDVPKGSRALLTDEVYAGVEDRPTGGRVVDVLKSGTSARVTVEWDQGGETVSEEFYVREKGATALLFDRWVLDKPSVPKVRAYDHIPYDVAEVSVNGVTMSADDALSFWALPGTYTLALPVADGDESVLVSTEKTVTVLPGPGSKHVFSGSEELAYELTDEGATTARTAATDLLAATCLAATVVDVHECDLRPWATRADEATDVVWTLDGPAVVEVAPGDDGTVLGRVSGNATVAYNVPERSYRPAESLSESTDFEFWIRWTVDGGELVDPELSRYEFWD